MNWTFSFSENLFCVFWGILFCVMVSCNSDQVNSAENQTERASSITTTRAKQVFYSIPSPLQMASLLKKSGAKYNINNLNPTENVSKYTSSSDMALNLGVYGTDMSLASIFNQAQETVLYLQQVNKLAKNLSISGAFNETLASRLEANSENNDSVLLIISEAYWEADAQLKEENRQSISALIISGGWIEGLYVATKIAKETKNEAVIKRVAEQKLSLNNLLGLLETHAADDESVKEVIGLLKELKTAYEPIKVAADNPTATTDVKSRLTTIASNGTVSVISQEELDFVSKKIEYIRNSIIN